MRTGLSKHATTILVAMVTAAITAGGPALAAAVAEAVNADTVDHKHAVGSGATVEGRAGKLVATNSAGRLPNNIIERAPDAAKLDGMSANGLTRVASVSSGATTELTDAFQTYGSTMRITAPSAGYVLVTSAVTVLENSACAEPCTVVGHIRHVEGATTSFDLMDSASAGYATLPGTAVFVVEPGLNRFQLRVRREMNQGGDLYAYTQNMSGVFSPFNHTGAAPLS